MFTLEEKIFNFKLVIGFSWNYQPRKELRVLEDKEALSDRENIED